MLPQNKKSYRSRYQRDYLHPEISNLCFLLKVEDRTTAKKEGNNAAYS